MNDRLRVGHATPWRVLQTVAVFSLVTAAASPASALPFAYITNFGSASVSVIDTATNTVVATVPVGAAPFGVAVNRAGTRAWVADADGNAVDAVGDAVNHEVAA